MLNKVLCWIGIIWGGGIIIRWFINGPSFPGSASEAGRFTAFLFGIVVLGISIYNLRKDSSKKPKAK